MPASREPTRATSDDATRKEKHAEPRGPKTGARRHVRIAALADLHYTKTSHGVLHEVLGQLRDPPDVLLLCGDLTDHGLPDEARTLAQDLDTVRMPIIAVLGNHDFESGQQDDVTEILRLASVRILDGESVVIDGIGFAGVKGFAGGFDRRMLQPWGEPAIKTFVQTAIDEATKLERALARLRTTHRIVLMHYSPVQGTADGEPPEILPFLGSSRLEEPLNRHRVHAVFHGHAHRGSPEAHTSAGIPVYNVSLPLLRRTSRDAPPIRVIDLPAGAQQTAAS